LHLPRFVPALGSDDDPVALATLATVAAANITQDFS
jgi:hypothetical protein